MLKYYTNYLDNISTTPSQSYTELFQATIDEQWSNTTQLITVLEQNDIGSDIYNELEVRVDYALNMGTGYKQDDDYKLFSFQNLSHNVSKGLLYQYDDDYWLTINTSELGSISKDINVRRCNNLMQWIEPSTGKLNQVPCVIEYVLESPNALKDKEVVVANGHISILCQGNLLTRNIPKNTRFIFNGQPFKFLATQNMINNGIFENQNSDLLYLDMYLDMIEADDDIVNNIANSQRYQYSINIEPTVQEQVKNFEGKVSTTVLLNNNVVSREVNYSGNENVSVNATTGDYVLIGEVGSVAIISANIVGNPNLIDTTNINIVQSVEDSYELIVEPIYENINVGNEVSFEVNEYKNGVRQQTQCGYVVSGLDSSYYNLSQSENTFMLKAIKFSSIPLSIDFSTSNCHKNIQIICKSAF